MFAELSASQFCFYRRCSTISAKELLINDDIRAKEVRLLDSQGDQVGIMSLAEAKAFAYDQGVDLVCIAPQATPPVCRAMDYGKYRYEQDKRVKEQRKKQQTVEVKEVQLSCRIDKHDFDTKANRAIKFLTEGNKVRVCLRFKGREMAHQELGKEVIAKFQEACAEVSTVDKKPVLEGRQIIMFLSPVKQGKAGEKAAKQTESDEAAE
ncbi:MAG: translation initiation factor IF-3 [Clostridia bacterium]|nr:translation initiation factor IF-3 [Clostridia bacterium]MBQ8474696.1 translation initiation factor IF-3 [Clostridia bacterium]